MTLRQKFLITFGGLAALALVIAMVTVWDTVSWHTEDDRLQHHYLRSILLQRIRAAMFRAFKEIPDSIVSNDLQARQEFIDTLRPVENDFSQWEALADTDTERAEVTQVRAAFDELKKEGFKIFDMVDAGRKTTAFELMEDELEELLDNFERRSETAVALDRKRREVIRDQAQRVRQASRLILYIASFGALSLILLLAAYLRSDLITPLQNIENGLQAVSGGNLEHRLSEDRGDELGRINAAFNHMATVLAEREQMISLSTTEASTDDGDKANNANSLIDHAWSEKPSRLTLHTLVAQLRARVVQLYESGAESSTKKERRRDKEQEAVLSQVDRLLQAIGRMTGFAFPLDLSLSRTDVHALLYEAVLQFHDELVERGVSFELDVAPDVQAALMDRLKMREVIRELFRNALRALPEHGGRIGLRASLDANDNQLVIEVADDGEGADESFIDRALDLARTVPDQPPTVGLRLTKAIVEEHGGQLSVKSVPQQGTYVQIRLPFHP